jgi:hypothetical protein
MAPNLSASQNVRIRDMIVDGAANYAEIARAKGTTLLLCSKASADILRRSPSLLSPPLIRLEFLDTVTLPLVASTQLLNTSTLEQ